MTGPDRPIFTAQEANSVGSTIIVLATGLAGCSTPVVASAAEVPVTPVVVPAEPIQKITPSVFPKPSPIPEKSPTLTSTPTKEAPLPDKYEKVLNYSAEEVIENAVIPLINAFDVNKDGKINSDPDNNELATVNFAVVDTQAVLDSFAKFNVQRGRNGEILTPKTIHISQTIYEYLGNKYIGELALKGITLLPGIDASTDGPLDKAPGNDDGVYELIIPEDGHGAYMVRNAKINTWDDGTERRYITGTFIMQSKSGVWFEVPASDGAFMVSAGEFNKQSLGFVLAKIINGKLSVFDPTDFNGANDLNDWKSAPALLETEKITPTPSTELTNQYKGLDINSDPATWTKEYDLENGKKFNMSKYWQEVSIDPLTSKTYREGKNMTQVEMENQDKLALKVLNNIRRAFLVDNKLITATEAKNMSDWDLFLQHVKYGIENKQLINLAPEEIRNIEMMINLPSYYEGMSIQEGIMNELRLSKEKADEKLAKMKDGSLSYKMTIFGRETTIPRTAFEGVLGDLAGVFRLPGVNPEDMVGTLTHYIDKQTGKDYWFVTVVPLKDTELLKESMILRMDPWGNPIISSLTDDLLIEQVRNEGKRIPATLEDLKNNLGKKINFWNETHKVADSIFYSDMEIIDYVFFDESFPPEDKSIWPWEMNPTTPTPASPTRVVPSVTPRPTSNPTIPAGVVSDK